MKKFSFLIICILLFQVFSACYLSAKDNNAYFLFKETSSVVDRVNEELSDTADENKLQKIKGEISDIPDLSITTNYDDDPLKPDLYIYCENEFNPKSLRVIPYITTYDSYKVDWGDKTTVIEGSFKTISETTHKYISGKYSLVFSVLYNGTWYSKSYSIFAGQPPGITILYDVRGPICAGDSVKFRFIANNVKGTKYKVTFSDLKKDSILNFDDKNPLPESITYVYEKTSCGKSYVADKKTYPNAFGVNVLAQNDCGTTPATAGPIYVSSKPEPKQGRVLKKCVNQEFIITNTTEAKTSPDGENPSCITAYKRIWKIFKFDGSNIEAVEGVDFTLRASSLGTSNSIDPLDPDLWFSGTTNLNITFLKYGKYELRLLLANPCFVDFASQVVYIEPSIVASFSESYEKNDCEDMLVTLKNTTNINPDVFFDQPSFKWSVSPAGNYYTGGTNEFSNEPKFNFKISGTYVVTLSYSGSSCVNVSAKKSFTVQGLPIVKINKMDACLNDDSVNIMATATINTYGLKIDKYYWKITDVSGTLLAEDTIDKPVFSIHNTGKYFVYLDVSTSCGTTSANSTFLIEPEPTIQKINDIKVCENELVSRINFNVTNSSQGVRWINDNISIGLNNSDTLPKGQEFITSFVAKNPGNDTIKAKITVFPLNVGCQGEPESFIITVLPSKVKTNFDSITVCQGEVIDSLEVTYNGKRNNPTATYQWYSYKENFTNALSGETNSTFLPLTQQSNNYFCKVTPQNGCKAINSDTLKLIVHPTPHIMNYNLKINTGDSLILIPQNGDTSGGITNSIPTGTKYSWTISNVIPTGSVTGYTTDSIQHDSIAQLLFNLTLENAKIIYKVVPSTTLCIGDTFTVTVAVVPPIYADVDSVNIKCFGENNGIIRVTNIVGIMGTDKPVVICKRLSDDQEFPGEIQNEYATFENLKPGRYEITIIDKDGLGIPFVDSIDVFEPELIQLTIPQKRNLTCFGQNDGEISLDIVKRVLGSNEYEKRWYYSSDSITWSQYVDNVFDPFYIKNLKRGYYYFKVTDINGCTDSTAVISINEPSQFWLTADVTDAYDCNNTNSGIIQIRDFGGGTTTSIDDYKFSLTNNSVTSNNLTINELRNKLTSLSPGTYDITMTDKLNCNALKKTFKIIRPDTLGVEFSSVLNFDCLNNSISQVNNVVVSGGVPFINTVTGERYYNIEWKIGNNVVGTGTTFETTTSGELIYLSVTDQRSCTFTGNTSFKSVVPKLTWKDSLIDCNTHKYRFTAIIRNDLTQNYTFKWKFGNVEKITTAPILDYVFPDIGNYNVQLIISRKDGICDYPLFKQILVESSPNLNITEVNGGTWDEVKKEVRFCKGETVRIKVDGANTYYWGIDGSTDDFVTITEQGDYFVEGKSASGCSSTLEFKALNNIYNYTIITDKDNPEKNNEVLLNFNNTTVNFWTQYVAGSSYAWDFGDGSSQFLGFKSTHKFNVSSKNYYDVLLQVTNPDGCNEEATKRIWFEVDNLSNTITPNGDGINDVFMAGWKIQVFNRNGLLLYDGTGGWDGTHNGKPVSSDTYFYILTYSSTESAKTKAGYITVIR